MDEAPLNLNIPKSTTVLAIRSNKVNFRTQGQENWRIIVILAILAPREKLIPLFIFKEKEGEDAERKLQQIEYVEMFLYSDKKMKG